MEAKLTPVMRQYLEIKKNHPEDILFFRMGDFYEMFFDDAETASKILDIALTSRQNDIPMCGVPYHAAESYIARLIKAGRRVAICEQMETTPSSGSIVKREVVRIITAGTLMEQNLIQGEENNFLCSAIVMDDEIGLAFVDISTGDFYLSAIKNSFELFRGEISRFSPREIVFRDNSKKPDPRIPEFLKNFGIALASLNEWIYDIEYLNGIIAESFGIAKIKGFGLEAPAEILAAGSVLHYLRDTQKRALDHLKFPRRFSSSSYMALDEATVRNLEIIRNQQDGSKNRTLFSVLNKTRTAMGKRHLERVLLQPLLDVTEIEKRLNVVQYFHEYHALALQTQKLLDDVADLERLLSRLTMGRSTARDFPMLSKSLKAAVKLRNFLVEQSLEDVQNLAKKITDLNELADRIDASILDEPALTPEQGRVIREGHNAEIDRLYDLTRDAKKWLLDFEEKEKKKLGIATLKVKYNRVFGYYIEVSRGQTAKVPEGYSRKQTLKGAERYTNEELQKFEEETLSASETLIELENKELEALLSETLKESHHIQSCAEAIGEIDTLLSFAIAALEHRFVRPNFNAEGLMQIADARHPIVEKYYTKEVFIPNDIFLDTKNNIIKIITGPNMSGKSTYIRTAAIVQLMSQIGSFVPAREAIVSPVDRIFTRIGASDNISMGESTFLVEMVEAAIILNNATEKSLIIMDEVGRGTSTYDGLAIAWAVVEYLARYIRAKTLFATHYHELTRLGGKNGVVNYTVLVKETLDGVEFLHKVVPGSVDRSYGIHVAKLAGIPKAVTSRAAQILKRLEKHSKSRNDKDADNDSASEQLEIFNAANHRVIRAMREIDLNTLTPLDALNILSKLKKEIE